MAFLTEYLIKLSASLAILYIFYRFVLSPLTFYQWNRFFLLFYSLLSFVLPFVDITPWINRQGIADIQLINNIPALDKYSLKTDDLSWMPNISEWLLALLCAGMIIRFLRLAIQYISLNHIRKNAVLLNSMDNIRLYDTEKCTGPFSFGTSIYINRQLHTAEELESIIQHEIVHVKQKHTIDLLTAELLCIINWYNPFAWLIRYAIRQNLEFIADNKIISSGHNKKEYQYLLLKIAGAPVYGMANNFNLLNLKKRIAMMNKIKSAKLQMTKFVFTLPLLAVVLLAFRTNHPTANIDSKAISVDRLMVLDTMPKSSKPVLPAVTKEINKNIDNKVGASVKAETTVNIEGPLCFVDGVETPYAEIKLIKSDRIESMNVLKGAAATDKYGDKGKNGVLEIKIKSNSPK